MHYLGRFLDRVEEIALIVLLALITVIAFADVVVRNLGIPLSRVQDLVPNLFVWVTWIGIPYAIRKREHFRVRVLPESVVKDLAGALEWIAAVVGLGFFCVVGVYAAKVVVLDLKLGNTTSLGYPAVFLDSAILVGAVLSAVRILQGVLGPAASVATEGEP